MITEHEGQSFCGRTARCSEVNVGLPTFGIKRNVTLSFLHLLFQHSLCSRDESSLLHDTTRHEVKGDFSFGRVEFG